MRGGRKGWMNNKKTREKGEHRERRLSSITNGNSIELL